MNLNLMMGTATGENWHLKVCMQKVNILYKEKILRTNCILFMS